MCVCDETNDAAGVDTARVPLVAAVSCTALDIMDSASLDAYWMGTPKGSNALGNKVLCLYVKRFASELEVGQRTMRGVPFGLQEMPDTQCVTGCARQCVTGRARNIQSVRVCI